MTSHVKNSRYAHFDARYGSEFGAARITRVGAAGRYHVLDVDTPYRNVQIAVSPTGRSVRVWIDGVELRRGDAPVMPDDPREK